MKQLFTLFTFCLPLFICAQSFEISPSNEIYKEYHIGDFTSENVSVKNISGEEMTVLFETLSNTFSENWDGALCAGVDCFINIPPGGNLQSISDGEESVMGFTFNIKEDIGEGTIVFRVFNAENESISDTVSITYNITESPTSTSNLDNDFNFIASPNPTTGILNINNDQLNNYQIRINTLTGQLILNKKVTGKTWNGDISNLPAGIYILTAISEEGLVFREKIYKI